LHDRVQQAAYALIDESAKQVVHLQIGRTGKTSPEQQPDRLFAIVDHLDRGLSCYCSTRTNHCQTEFNGEESKVSNGL